MFVRIEESTACASLLVAPAALPVLVEDEPELPQAATVRERPATSRRASAERRDMDLLGERACQVTVVRGRYRPRSVSTGSYGGLALISLRTTIVMPVQASSVDGRIAAALERVR
jgi:hypothetical protein